MKRIVWFLCLLFIPIAGCKKIRSLANININIPYSTEVTMPVFYNEGVPIPFGGFSGTVGPVAIETHSQEYIDKYHTSPEKILHVKLSQLSLKVVAPKGEVIDFMDTTRIYISTAGQPEFLAAYYYGKPTGQDSIAMICSEQNLKSYFLADIMYIKLNAHFNRVPQPGTRLKINAVFNMLANPLY